jgi:hypothetical protein
MKERACMRNCASGSVNSIPTDNDVLPTVTPEQHAFLEALGFVAAVDRAPLGNWRDFLFAP